MIKRCHTIRALGEIASGQCSTDCAQRLMKYVDEKAGDMDEDKLFSKTA